MNEIKTFTSSEFGEVRTISINNEPYFVGKDVAEILGYENQNRDIVRHVDEEDRMMLDGKTQYQNGIELGQRGGWVINESGLYSLILSSKLPTAKKFKRWVTSEVLPSIRKNGGYVQDQEKLSDDELIAKALVVAQNIIKQKEILLQQKEKQIEEQKPLVEFAEHVSATADMIDFSELAKIANNEHIDIGRNRLVRFLKEKKILMANNVPYQRYINAKYFDVREVTKNTVYGVKVFPKTTITGKGQLFLIDLLKREYKTEN